MKKNAAALLSIVLILSMVFGTTLVFAANKAPVTAPVTAPALIDPATVAISNTGGFVVTNKGIMYMMPGGSYLKSSWLFIGSQIWCFDDEGYMIVGRRIIDSKLWNMTYEGMPLLLDPPMPVSVPASVSAPPVADKKDGAKAPAQGAQAPAAAAPGGVQAPAASAPGGAQAPAVPAPTTPAPAVPAVPVSGNVIPGAVSANGLNAPAAAPTAVQAVSQNMPALPQTVDTPQSVTPVTAPAATDNSQLLVQNYENKKMT